MHLQFGGGGGGARCDDARARGPAAYGSVLVDTSYLKANKKWVTGGDAEQLRARPWRHNMNETALKLRRRGIQKSKVKVFTQLEPHTRQRLVARPQTAADMRPAREYY